MKFKYIVYGLGVHSDFPLWAMPVEDCPADVRVRQGEGFLLEAKSSAPAVEQVDDEIRITWPGVGAARVHAGHEIVVERGPEADEDHLRHMVGGLCLGLLLHQRGYLTLHGSVVDIFGGAVIFVGGKHAGKSTLAAAMQRNGHPILSDDVAAIDMSNSQTPRIVPGPSSLNLWPDTAAHFGHDSDRQPRIWPHNPKRMHLAEPSTREPLPLRCIFVLEMLKEGTEPIFDGPLEGRDAFVELVRHSHALRMVADPASLPSYTRHCATLSCSVPVVRLKRPWSLDLLEEIVCRVEERLEHSTAVPTVSTLPGT